MSELYPVGITDLRELPHTHVQAIGHAMGFLSFEELQPDERPPKRIWLDSKKLKEHMDWVKEKRDAEIKGAAEPEKQIDDPVQNPLTAGLRGHA